MNGKSRAMHRTPAVQTAFPFLFPLAQAELSSPGSRDRDLLRSASANSTPQITINSVGLRNSLQPSLCLAHGRSEQCKQALLPSAWWGCACPPWSPVPHWYTASHTPSRLSHTETQRHHQVGPLPSLWLWLWSLSCSDFTLLTNELFHKSGVLTHSITLHSLSLSARSLDKNW